MHREKVNIHDKHGNIIGGFPFAALMPLLGAAVGPLLNKVLGNGVHSIHHPLLGNIPLRKTKETKRGHGLTDSESYIVPNIITGQTPHGGAAGFGAAGFGRGATGFGNGVTKHRRPTTRGGHSYWEGYMEPGNTTYNENAYPTKGGRTKKHHSKKGGFAVDQMHSHAYTGFSPGNYQTMFPVSQV